MSIMLMNIFFYLYMVIALILMLYGMHCYIMLYHFYKKQKECRRNIDNTVRMFEENNKPEDYPFVTIQLPIYNEREVVKKTNL